MAGPKGSECVVSVHPGGVLLCPLPPQQDRLQKWQGLMQKESAGCSLETQEEFQGSNSKMSNECRPF